MTTEDLLVWQEDFMRLNFSFENEDIKKNINMLVAGPSVGKSFLKKYLIEKKIAAIIPPLDDEEDIMEQISLDREKDRTSNLKMYIFDGLCLNPNEDDIHMILNVCQKLKNQGYIVWIFTNVIPSEDECGNIKFSFWGVDNQNLGYKNWRLSKFDVEE